MSGRVPVLRQHDVAEALAQSVDDRDDLVAVGHGEAAAGAEIILHVDDDQGGRGVDHRLLLGLEGARRRGGGQDGRAGDQLAAVDRESVCHHNLRAGTPIILLEDRGIGNPSRCKRRPPRRCFSVQVAAYLNSTLTTPGAALTALAICWLTG